MALSVIVWMCETVTRSLKQKQPLRHEQQRLGDINISVRCVETEKGGDRVRNMKAAMRGGPLPY